MQDPFFILGNPRSGTTLFRLMLNSHPLICVPPESGFAHWWYDKYKFWDVSCNNDNLRVLDFIKDVLSSKKIELWNLDESRIARKISLTQPSNYAELCRCVYLAYAGDDVQLIGDKNNYYINHLDDIVSIFPNTKFIHLARDGRDVACSYRGIKTLNSASPYKPLLPYNISEIAKQWGENVNRIEKFISDKKSLTLKYEDLIHNPDSTLQKVCNFLGVNYSKRMLLFYEKNNNDEPDLTLDWKRKTLESLNSSNSEKYKYILSTREIQIFNGIAYEQLRSFGYEI
jgi:hypothetical protein